MNIPLLLGLFSGVPSQQDGKPGLDSTSRDGAAGDVPHGGGIVQGNGAIGSAGLQIACGLVCQVEGRWETVYWSGPELTDPESLASETLARDEVVVRGGFSAVEVKAVSPLDSEINSMSRTQGRGGVESSSSQGSEVLPGIPNLALLMSINGRPATAGMLRTFAVTLGRFLALHRDRQNDVRRLGQASQMLKSAASWQQISDDQALLESIARCACDVLACDRATIFLWDKAGGRLIGRPAIGVEGGALEVPDNAGIVGEVLQSGSPRWWAVGGVDEARLNRRVDQAQNYRTRSLLAVPMFNSFHQIIGVFEAINARADDHREGVFDAVDVRTLTELALHATVAIDTQRKLVNLERTRDRLISAAAQSIALIGEHQSIRELRNNATKVAPTELSVLVLGRNGTGKEILAQHIHYHSRRRGGPFVAVNCAALVESLLESELFGHEKGSFTDASETRQGKFELASGGTLFLDEVGDLSPSGQAKLLRVLEERVIVRVGGTQPIPVDVRVIAATNQPLQEMIVQRRFREDLFFRLNIVSLTLPPLAQRGDDLMLLADHFLKHFCQQIGRAAPQFDPAARRAMLEHSWPGNVRELRNTIERVCYLTTGDVIAAQDLMIHRAAPSSSGGLNAASVSGLSDVDANLNEATRVFQIAHIEQAIQSCGGNMTEAAVRLGLHRSNLYRKMRQLGMPTSDSSV